MILVFFMTFFIGVGLALASGWKLTLVISTFIPIMIITGSLMAKVSPMVYQLHDHHWVIDGQSKPHGVPISAMRFLLTRCKIIMKCISTRIICDAFVNRY